MSHLAIARKWRPQVFEDIVGQRHVTRTLQNAIRLERVHHAFLFTGARGVGKTSAARVLARALNCEKGPGPNPCNECGSCTEMLSGSYPDVVEIDAASHNSVDDIRDLVEKARYTPQRGRYKVYIIDEVHMVTKQGFNALLKTLEEPPPHVRFILATTDPQKLLDTVISRCQRFDFKMIPVRTIYEHLHHVATQEGVAIPEGSLMTIAREGGGSMRDAQSLLDQVLSFSEGSVSEEEVAEILGFIDRSILYDALEGAVSGDAAKALEVLGRVRLYGYDVRAFSGQLLEAVRNVLVVRLVEDASKLMDLPDEEINRLRALASDRNPALLRQQFDVLAETVDAITRSEQPMLLLETALVKMAAVRPFVPIERLLERLDDLERRLAKAGARGGGGGGGGSSRGELRRPSRSSAPEPSFRASRDDAPLTAPRSPAPAPPRAPEPPAARPAPAAKPPPAARPAPRSTGSMVSNILSYQRDGASAPAPAAPSPSSEPVRPPSNGAAAAPRPAPHTPSNLLADLNRRPETSRRQVAVDPSRDDPPGSDLCDGPRWRQFVHSLADDENLGVARGLLARSGFLGVDGTTIRIGFYSSVTLSKVGAELEDDAVQAALVDSFGAGVTLETLMDEDGSSGRSLAEEIDRIKAARTSKLRAEALTHPAIGATQEVFPGARIIGEPRVPPIEEVTDVR